jgi:PAS domain-containing protein
MTESRSREIPAGPRLTVLVAVMYALAGGVLSFLGWVLDIPLFTDWDRNGISIQPNAALCVILSSLGLLFAARARLRIAAFCGSVVFLVGGLTLFQWITGLSAGLDALLLFGRQWGQRGVLFPGRMGPPGSLSWTLIGTALVLVGCPPRLRRFVPPLGLLTAAISALSLIGYLYDIDKLYALPTYTVIALQTSSFILAISIGLIASHPLQEPLRTLLDPGGAGMLARRALPLLLVIPVGLGFLGVRGRDAGLYDMRMAMAMLVLALIGLLWVVLWRSLMALRLREEQAQRSERSERERATLLQTVLDTSPAPIWFALDRSCERIKGNAATHALLGAPAGASLSTEASRERHGYRWLRDGVEVPIEMLPIHRAALEGRPVSAEEYEFVRGDGTRVWLLVHASPLLEGGSPRGAIAVGVDITARKLAEEGLRSSEERFRSLVSVITDVPWTTDARGAFVSMQEAWSQYTGQSWEQMRGFGWADVIHPEDRERIETLWQKALRSGSLYRSSGRIWHAPTRPCGNGLGRAPTSTSARSPRRRCARPTAARTSSWRRWHTSCATRSLRSATACRSCGWRGPIRPRTDRSWT